MKQCLLCEKELRENHQFRELFLLCHQEEWICKECKESFQEIGSIHCPRCFKEKEVQICKDCELWEQKGNIVHHEAIYRYNESMKEYFKRYKFEGDKLLGKVFSRRLKTELKKYKNYIVVPTPISKEKKQERGFNQVSTILDDEKIKYSDIFEKKDGVAQSKKTREERLKTGQNFRLKGKVQKNKQYLIVDDIYTTGKTIELMKQLLTEKGVKEIKTFSIAR